MINHLIKKIMCSSVIMMGALSCAAQIATVSGPDGRLKVNVDVKDGKPVYSITYDGKQMLDESPLGFVANTGDYSKNLTYIDSKESKIDTRYKLDRSKVADVHYVANELKVNLKNDKKLITVTFRVSNNDVAFRYELPRIGDNAGIRIMNEVTGFDLPSKSTTFMCPQSKPMLGWKRTKPSYEEGYDYDAPMTKKSRYGEGYTFPCLFRVGDDGWVLISETGVDSHYCGSCLSDMSGDGLYTIKFPMKGENDGIGDVEPTFTLPGATPWRTITIGSTLKPIVETTAPWDNVEQLYDSNCQYKYGKGTWSWIVWQDNSINYDDQVKYIQLAKSMGYQYVLIDNYWDENIGYERMEELVKYAQSQGVDVFLWWSSSGYWNDIEQGPINKMYDQITRKKVMKWMNKIGVKGIKVDFFGGDKQETMRLYEAILSDANDYDLMVIFHGCTLPRGWERMYPNYVGSEAVLASENIYFSQHACDVEAKDTSTHPFIRNAVGCMEFGGSFMNRNIKKGNKGGNKRKTTDCHEMAQAVLFQNPIQNFALTPENLLPLEDGGAPQVSLDFMKQVPTTWSETHYIAGFPGKYCVLARRNGNTYYIAGNNAEGERDLVLDLSSFIKKGQVVDLYSDKADREPNKTQQKITNPKKVKVHLLDKGGFVFVVDVK